LQQRIALQIMKINAFSNPFLSLFEAFSEPIEGDSLLNKKLTLHIFRHTFYKWMFISDGQRIEKARRLAGHSNIATTSRHLKDSYSDLADAVEALPKF
jgi:integrase